MDVKSAFLNGFINEEVYVEQPHGFQSFNFPNHVFRLKKALYGLKQAPRACMMGELNFFLGLQIKQLQKGTFINQAKYIRDLLKRFNMEEAKTMNTPMSSSIKLDMDEKGKPVNSTMYRGMIGSLLYLTASRPDIMYSVCLCARFQSCPKESHLSAVKRILIYLKGTMDIGLWYPKGDNFELIGYSDADFAGCKVERKSTSGTYHFLGHSLVSWHSKKQNSVALSTAKAEYIAAGFAINISKNPVQHSRTKHIDIRHHFLRDHAQKGDITLEFVSTKDQLVDIFTKPLSEEQFVDIRRQLGVRDGHFQGSRQAPY
uniref:Reverse transcriptase Ty1/copia-type domain-containing protein n=1 Tax=Vitis vinifera TaxID=29760 RepID=A5BT96_VITVI|nr:hypothetical protein VITISV_036637 [Vitis vinifera]